ncbi:MAG: hypothetical protein VW338_19485 [Rhodospirillaceae bacterium]
MSAAARPSAPLLARIVAILLVVVAATGCSADEARDAVHAGGKLIYDTLKAAKDADRAGF